MFHHFYTCLDHRDESDSSFQTRIEDSCQQVSLRLLQVPPFWQGLHCEIPDADTCLHHGCSNGGTCSEHSPTGQYTCQCPTGFAGSFCKYRLRCDMNPTCHLPCQNDGVCVHFNDVAFCKCASGWGGPDCSFDVNQCSQLPCQNGGTCINSPGSYSCNCPPNFTGLNCDTVSAMSCNNNPCRHGATCALVNGSVSCACPDGFRGELCDMQGETYEVCMCIHSCHIMCLHVLRALLSCVWIVATKCVLY